MDVVSLLNNGNSAVDQQKRVASPQIPIRNRTPWDAGGYSMPINTMSKPSISPTRQNSCEEGRSERSPSTAHKASDSRSSLSSFASLHSTTHSRFSSMSTVNSWNPIEGTDCLSPELRTVREALELASLSMKMDSEDQTMTDVRPRTSVSPTSSLGTLAAAAEHQLYDLNQKSRRQSARSPSSMDDSMISPPFVTISPARPSSPSDAILIKRTSIPSLRVNTGGLMLNRELPEIDHNYLQTHNHFQSCSTHLKGHKRAVSAPDFNFNMPQQQSHGPQAEPTPPSSHHPDTSSPVTPAAYPTPDTPPATSGETRATSVVCMYIPNCDTGSQLRKAISHIFGRNKMCTRLIPQDVWVHYCRKHYQRSRYRNPKEYAKLQCDLVQQQIRRVHEWSQSNMKNGLPGTVQDWGLAVRKREQKRLDDLGGSSRKRRANTFERAESDEEENVEEADSAKVPPTAVPGWLLAHCGQGYTTHGILEIFNRLHTEILSDRMSCFPDIEILPNIVVDREGEGPPKGYAKRSGAASGHKRSQSLGVGIKSDYFSQDRRLSQVSQSSATEDSSYESPVQKKRRPNHLDDTDEGLQFQKSRERSLESARRIPYHAHRPVFANIDEHQVMEDAYQQHDTPMRDPFYSRSPAYSQPALAAPIPQRLSSTPMASQLEFVNMQESAHRRPSHHRSMSDLGAAQRAQLHYPPPQSYGQSSLNQHEGSYMDSFARPGTYEPQPQHETYQRRAGGHIRNQSTPMISSFYAEPLCRSSEAAAPSHAYPKPTQCGLNHPRRLRETNETRSLYAERR